MKKLNILLAFLMAGLCLNLNAQTTPLNEAVDFTATDCHGNEIHLFDILDRGQAVLIDFFFYTCSGCRQIAPYISGAYTEMGCNMHDVYFMEISYCDSDALCQQWCDEYNVEFPTIGVQGGGNEINDLYGITACPTVILIMPDRSIPIKGYPPMFPFSVQEVVQLLGQYGGLEPNDCDVPTGEVIITPDTLHLYFHGCSPHGEQVVISNLTSDDLVINRCYAENFHVECLYEGENIAETGMIVPIGETVILDTYASPTAKDVYGTLYIDTDFGVYTINIYYETAYGMEEQQAALSVYPNPANDVVSIFGENLGTVSLYNALGQKIDEFQTDGKRLDIPTAHYPNGMFFVKTSQGQAQRFMIAH